MRNSTGTSRTTSKSARSNVTRAAPHSFAGAIDRLVGAQVRGQFASCHRQRAAHHDGREVRLRFQFQVEVLELLRRQTAGRRGRAEIELSESTGVRLALAAGQQRAVVSDHAIVHGRGARSAGCGLSLHGKVVRQCGLQGGRPEHDRPDRLLGPGHAGRTSGDRTFQRAGAEAGEPQVAQQQRSGQGHGPIGPAAGGGSDVGGRLDERDRRQLQFGGLGQDRGLAPDFVVQACHVRLGGNSPAQRFRFVLRQQVVDEFPKPLFQIVWTIHNP